MDKEEERLRLFDAVSQLLIAISRRTPLVLILDDLHWADRGTVAMLSHVAHFVSGQFDPVDRRLPRRRSRPQASARRCARSVSAGNGISSSYAERSSRIATSPICSA